MLLMVCRDYLYTNSNVNSLGQESFFTPGMGSGLTDGTSFMQGENCIDSGLTAGATMTSMVGGDNQPDVYNQLNLGETPLELGHRSNIMLKCSKKPAEIIIVQGTMSLTNVFDEPINTDGDPVPGYPNSAAPIVRVNVGLYDNLSDFHTNELTHDFANEDLLNRSHIVDTLMVPLAVAKIDNNISLFDYKDGLENKFPEPELAWTSIELFGDNTQIYAGLHKSTGDNDCCLCNEIALECFWAVNKICAYDCYGNQMKLSVDVTSPTNQVSKLEVSSNDHLASNLISCDDLSWESKPEDECPVITITTCKQISYMKFFQCYSNDSNGRTSCTKYFKWNL